MPKVANIMHENGKYWVHRITKQEMYGVFKAGITHGTSDSMYPLTDDGLSIAIARCDYLAEQERKIKEAMPKKRPETLIRVTDKKAYRVRPLTIEGKGQFVSIRRMVKKSGSLVFQPVKGQCVTVEADQVSRLIDVLKATLKSMNEPKPKKP